MKILGVHLEAWIYLIKESLKRRLRKMTTTVMKPPFSAFFCPLADTCTFKNLKECAKCLRYVRNVEEMY